MIEKAYRFTDRHVAAPLDEYDDPIPGGGRSYVQQHTFEVVRHTPKGFWVRGIAGKRWVNASARCKYAALDKRIALESYVARKTRHISILTAQLETVRNLKNEALGMLKVLEVTADV